MAGPTLSEIETRTWAVLEAAEKRILSSVINLRKTEDVLARSHATLERAKHVLRIDAQTSSNGSA